MSDDENSERRVIAHVRAGMPPKVMTLEEWSTWRDAETKRMNAQLQGKLDEASDRDVGDLALQTMIISTQGFAGPTCPTPFRVELRLAGGAMLLVHVWDMDDVLQLIDQMQPPAVRVDANPR